MNPNITTLFEITFDIAYLIAVWALVILMTNQLGAVDPRDRRVAGLIRLAFILLAAGDTGHVGFRVMAYLTGGLESQVNVFGTPMSLVGVGSLTTAFTVTLFYMLFVYIWKFRFNQPAGWFSNLLLAAGVVRLIFMALPGNDWGSVVPPQPISIYRNLPLIVQGVGVVILILNSAYKAQDATFKWIGWMIVISFAFYLPVILFAQKVPMLGMLMIPKTCAYLVVAFIAYRDMWVHPSRLAAEARGS
jgi:hypothetical protein